MDLGDIVEKYAMTNYIIGIDYIYVNVMEGNVKDKDRKPNLKEVTIVAPVKNQ